MFGSVRSDVGGSSSSVRSSGCSATAIIIMGGRRVGGGFSVSVPLTLAYFDLIFLIRAG